MTTLPPLCTKCLEICEPQPSGILQAWPGLCRDCFIFYLLHIFGNQWYILNPYPVHLHGYNRASMISVTLFSQLMHTT